MKKIYVTLVIGIQYLAYPQDLKFKIKLLIKRTDIEIASTGNSQEKKYLISTKAKSRARKNVPLTDLGTYFM